MSAARGSATAGSRLVALALAMVASSPLSATAQPVLPSQAAAPALAAIEGTLDVQYEDSDRGARLLHYLDTGTRRVRLQFTGPPPDLLTGARIRARGRLNGDTLALTSDATTVQTLSSGLANTFGDQRTIVILVNFQNAATQPYTPATAASVTFSTTSNWYVENSYRQTSLSGDVYGWFTIAMDNTTCDTNKIASLADAAATNAGAALANYTRKIYGFPSMSACSWWGLGSVGGRPSRSWINGTYSLKVVAHELGHNFGAYHSHAQPCDTAGCTMVEYGDPYDVMGNPSSGHMNAFQKERLGWLNYNVSPPLQTVTAAGSYRLDAMSTDTQQSKGLKILKEVDAYGRRTFYYVEARAKVGFDSGIAAGVIVHTGSEASASSSNSIDLQPTTTTSDYLLDVGQTLNDPALGLWVTTVSTDAGGAYVDINFNGAPCVPAPPTVQFSPTSTLWTRPATGVTYSLTVRNGDSLGCQASTFALAASIPNGWSMGWSAPDLQVAPGGTATANVTIVPAAGAAGPYSFSAAATRAGSNGSSVSGSLIVASALDLALTIAGGNTFTLTSSVRVGAMVVTGAPVTFTVRNPFGKVTTLNAVTDAGGNAKVTVRLRARDPRGAYQVSVSSTMNGVSGATAGSFSF